MSTPLSPRRFAAFVLLALSLGRGAVAQDGSVEKDEWQLVLIDEAKVGYQHRVVQKVELAGVPHWKVTTDTALTMNRLGSTISVTTTGFQIEDEAGRPVEIRSEANLSATKTITHVRIADGRAEITRQIAGPPQVQTIDWDPSWLGELAIERLSREKVDAGEKEFSFGTWSADLGPLVATTKVLGMQKVKIPGQGERELLLLRTTIDVQPGMVSDAYLDDALETQITITQMGMNMIAVPSTKADCIAAFAKPDTPEVFNKLSPVSNVRLPAPYRTDELLLSVKQTAAGNPLPPLADDRQTIVEQKGADEVRLRIRRVVPTGKFTRPVQPATPMEEECLASSQQIESDHPTIVRLAKEAVGDETDAWAAACKLEKFVHHYITNKSMSAALFWSASEVAEKRSGDCTEHGVLLAALCRAAGIPSRVAVGFLYYKHIWGGHMWTEVLLGGKWYALDGTLGNGGVDAAHLRLAADSLKSAELGRVFSNVALGFTLDIDVLAYTHGDKTVEVGAGRPDYAVDGNVYRHELYGISLAAPEGWTLAPNAKIGLEESVFVTLDAPGEGHDVDVQVIDVTYDFAIDKVKEGFLEPEGLTRVKPQPREIDGRPGRLFTARKGKDSYLFAAVMRDEMLVLLGCKLAEGQDDKALDPVLATLDLDA